MPRLALNHPDMLKMKDLYESGLSAKEVAEKMDWPLMSVHARLDRMGIQKRKPGTYAVDRRIKRQEHMVLDVIRSYVSGESEKSIANRHGIYRDAIKRILEENNVDRRGRSEAMYERMSQTSFEERQKLAFAANETWRNAGGHPEDLRAKMALSAQKSLCFLGYGENELCNEMHRIGINPIQQLAVARYNIDLAVDDFAIEFHNNPRHPMKIEKLRKRFDYLVDAGWSFLYVWCKCKKSGQCNFQDTANSLAGFIGDKTTRDFTLITCQGERTY